jgi:hypothetical protein
MAVENCLEYDGTGVALLHPLPKPTPPFACISASSPEGYRWSRLSDWYGGGYELLGVVLARLECEPDQPGWFTLWDDAAAVPEATEA